MPARTIYSIESHEQALNIWRQNGTRNARILHIDFHCDQRGLLINRKTQRAYSIWTRFPQLDEGNFLKYAIMEGIVSGIRWVHDEPGGRQDDIKSVKYESDVSALAHRMLLACRGDQGIPIQYEVMTVSQWDRIQPGEILDIDWDFFAAREYASDSIQSRIDAFLARDFDPVPEQTIVCYSPEYSHATKTEFRSFVKTLSDRFGADVIDVPRPPRIKPTSVLRSLPKPIYQPARQFYRLACLALRKRGIY